MTGDSRFPIELCSAENWIRSAGKTHVRRTIQDASKIGGETIGTQEIEHWTGQAKVYGEQVQVWGWCNPGLFPLYWYDLPVFIEEV